MLTKKLVIVDLESTGSDIKIHSIIQFGAVKLNKNFDIEDRFLQLVIPSTDEWDDGAFKVHKIEQQYAKNFGIPISECLDKFESFVGDSKQYFLAAWGIMFDLGMIRIAYDRLQRKNPFSYRCYDIASIVRWFLSIYTDLGKHCGESKCAQKLGVEIDHSKLHNALYDAEISALNLKKIFEHIRKEKVYNTIENSSKDV
jgi:DNA polymerase III epsilon subunit-like protein